MWLRRRYRVFYNPQGHGWYTAFRAGGGRKRFSLGVGTRAEAEEAVRRLDDPSPARDVARVAFVTWAQVQAQFLTFKSGQGLAPKSIDRYRAGLDAFGRYLASESVRHVDAITLPVLEGYTHWRTHTEKCDVKTAYNDSLVIKGVFKWASKPSRGIVKVNPALDWETLEPVKPKRRCYTVEEVERMESGVRAVLRPVVTMLAWTGMRIGELINLRWCDVDLDKRVVHVRVQEDWKPKGRRDRTVPVHPKVDAVLRSRPIGKWVFLGPRGGRLKETYALECLKADQRKLGMVPGDLHGLRRFFATTMMRAGVDAETVRQWGGWKSLETMLRYLADVNVKDSVEAMDKAVKTLAAS